MKATILGAGIAGLTTAIALQQKGIEIEIFEAAPKIQPVGAGLALAANAMQAFYKLGIADAIIAKGRKLPAFSFYNHRGIMLNSTNSIELGKKYGIDNFTIHRAALHSALLEQLGETPINLSKRAVGFTQNGNVITLQFADGSSHITQCLIVADGINSPIRRQLIPHSLPRYAGYVCWRAVIDSKGFDWSETSETFGPMGRFGITPLANNLLYWYACTNAPKDSKHYADYTVDDLRKHFAGYHHPIKEILDRTEDNALIYGPILDLAPLDKFAFGNILLIGDAAHATTPNLGQGACQAIEDAVVLADEMAKTTVYQNAFVNFEQRRLERTRYITLQSRKVGEVAQWQNPVLGWIRDRIMKNMPQSTKDKQFAKLFTVDF
ncbi:MAG: NAD(P)-binding protein [Bacteroidetes bacterium]|nr:MAG: NAD(P)-binding protein [Bacteroidota bacterium]